MKPITCLIIDDEPLAREGLASYAENIPFLQVVALCQNALEANQLLANQSVDVLFLDINMPQLSGMDFLRTLQNPPLVVLTTAYREFAIESYELDVIDYLMKPISFQRFLKACNKVKANIELRQATQDPEEEINYFFIKEDGKLIKINFDDILFMEGLKDYVFIHTKTARHMTLISLKAVEQQLPASNFLRTHRSFIVALDKVEGMDGNQLVIQDKLVPVSRTMRDEVYERLVGNRLWKRE
ncbi:MAG: LytR/AlgR family response regulator transcription factor [Flammeovirgaceae bacterium]